MATDRSHAHKYLKLAHRCLAWSMLVAIVATICTLAVSAQDAEPADEPAGMRMTDPDSEVGAPDDGESEATETTEIVETHRIEFFEYLRRGGSTIVFLILLSIIALTFTIERLVHLRRSAIQPAGLAAEARQLWGEKRFDDLRQLCDRRPSTLASIIKVFIKHRTSTALELSTMAGDIASRDIRGHLQRAYPIAIVATLAPLLGLLGTVIGMIESFEMVAIAGSMGDASVLAGGISKALVTTAAGLVIAVPALGIYHFFRSRTMNYSMDLEEEVNELQSEWFMETVDDQPGE